jgi:hypothetical protein
MRVHICAYSHDGQDHMMLGETEDQARHCCAYKLRNAKTAQGRFVHSLKKLLHRHSLTDDVAIHQQSDVHIPQPDRTPGSFS